jgi:hypothetical protein
MGAPEPEVDQAASEQWRRADTARAYLAAIEQERTFILRALEILTVEKPWYGDDAVARDLNADVDHIATIRKAAGLKWTNRGRRRSGTSAETAEDRELVVELLRANGGNVKKTTRESGVAESTVRAWKERYFLQNAA